MLKKLYIKNFALIEEIDLEFSSGMNIISGDTGSGKSLIIDALIIALGGRASSDFIRKDSKKAIIEAVFVFEDNHPIFDLILENDYDKMGNELIIRRELSAKGSSRAFINDSPCSISILKEFATQLADFHGQHDHQSLLKAEKHLETLDNSGDYNSQIELYKSGYKQLKSTIKEYKELIEKSERIKEKEDFERFQLEEIEKVNPEVNEDVKIEDELKIIENSEFLMSNCYDLESLLYASDDSVYDRLNQSIEILRNLRNIDPQFQEYIDEIKSSLISAKEIANFANEYKRDINHDPQHADKLRSRISSINKLKKKYGSIADIISLREKLESNLSLVDNLDYEIESLSNKIEKEKLELSDIALDLSEKRKEFSKEFAKKLEDILENLGIPNASIIFNFKHSISENNVSHLSLSLNGTHIKAFPYGIDKLELLISANKGEEEKSLSSIASGGEISRIMLSIKSILSEGNSLALMVFDEIDTGISGAIARKVGYEMKRISEKNQLLVITHLPQIVSLGDKNLKVNKIETGNKTYIEVLESKEEDKVIEIARMLAGDEISQSAIENARELINY